MLLYKIFLFLYAIFGVIGFIGLRYGSGDGGDIPIETHMLAIWLLCSPVITLWSVLMFCFGHRSWWLLVGFLGGLCGNLVFAFLYMLWAAFKQG